MNNSGHALLSNVPLLHRVMIYHMHTTFGCLLVHVLTLACILSRRCPSDVKAVLDVLGSGTFKSPHQDDDVFLRHVLLSRTGRESASS